MLQRLNTAAPDPDTDHVMFLADGRKITWREYGDPNGFPVLALHGTPGSRLKYRVAHNKALQRGLRLITPDRWGYGGTDHPKCPSFKGFADDALALMLHCNAYRFSVVGVSGGGPFAAAIAARYPGNIERLALVAPVAELADPKMTGKMSLFHRFCFRGTPRVPGAVRASFWCLRAVAMLAPPLAATLAIIRAGPSDKKVMRPRSMRRLLGLTFAEGLRNGCEGPVIDMSLFARKWDFDAATIPSKVQVWLGNEDRNVPIPAAVALGNSMPNSQVTLTNGQGHFWISKDLDIVLKWLSEPEISDRTAAQVECAEPGA
ncbi:MAG: alpha/beta hydrolase [Pseudomonadota bacterium]